MTLNTTLLKTKIPYFIALLAIGMCMSYLLKQFSIMHTITCVAICLYAVLKPNTFCIFPKEHEYDKYNIISALPSYLMMSGVTFIGLVIAHYMGFAVVDLITLISLPILTLLFLGIIDRSRYN